MAKKLDGAEDTQDNKVDESSQESSEKQSSKETLKFSEEDMEKEVKKRVSDVLAKRGDKVLPLEERVKNLETENLVLKEARLKDVAKAYGLTLEQVKEIGLDDPNKVEKLAQLFGKAQEQTKPSDKVEKPTIKPDSGKTIGGTGELTPEMVSKMSPEERFQRRSEIAKLPLM